MLHIGLAPLLLLSLNPSSLDCLYFMDNPGYSA